jgi:hypothetical protein
MAGPLCPISIYGSPVALLKFQMAPRFILLMSSGSKKKEPKASHSQRMWAEVSSSVPHLLHSGLSDSPIGWRYLLGVLCSVRRPVTALDWVLLKDRNLALAPRQGREINSRACLWVSPRPRHHTQFWLTNQRLILLRTSCLETPKASSGPTNFRAEPFFASSSAISFPHTPACPGIQYSPAACQVKISFNAFWHCWTNGDIVKQTSRGVESHSEHEFIINSVNDIYVPTCIAIC